MNPQKLTKVIINPDALGVGFFYPCQNSQRKKAALMIHARARRARAITGRSIHAHTMFADGGVSYRFFERTQQKGNP
jgi:hypothetical protein